MYARVTKFVLGPDTQWEADRMADLANLLLSDMQGFQGILCLSQYDIGEYQWTVFWETKEQADKAFEKTYPMFLDGLGDNLVFDRPIIQMYKVYDVKKIG